MTSFDFSNAIEDWEADGEHEYLFKHLSTDELFTVPGDNFDDAWEALYHYKGENWHSWALVHRKDIAESLAEMAHNENIKDVRTQEVSVHYAQRNGQDPTVPVRED